MREIIYGREISPYSSYLSVYTDRNQLLDAYFDDYYELKKFVIEGLSNTDFSAYPDDELK